MSNLVLLLGSTSTNYQFKNWSASSENNTISKQHSVILYHGIRSIIKLKLRLSGWWDIMSPCIVNISPVVKTRYVEFFYMLTNSYLPSFYAKWHPSIIEDILVDIYIYIYAIHCHLQTIIIFILLIKFILDKYPTMGKPR